MESEQAQVLESVATARDARESLERISRLAGECSGMIEQIATATEEQSSTTNETLVSGKDSVQGGQLKR